MPPFVTTAAPKEPGVPAMVRDPDSRAEGRRPRTKTPSTDSIDIELVRAAHPARDSITQIHTEDSLREAEAEANLILIAHPDNKGLGTRYLLTHGGSLEIGRSPSVAISLPDVLSVSRNHARVDYTGDGVVVQDLGSTNGSYVNDQKIRSSQLLRSGDRIQVGAVHFKFLLERDVEAAYHEAIYNLMMRDGLTGAYNKRKFDEELQRETGRAHRYRRPLSLVLLDLDHFKGINDSQGHLCGDFVLKQVADVARELLRLEQILARVGGEEFAVLCPETDAEGAMQLAERLRAELAEHSFHYASLELSLTSSFGVAELDAELSEPRQLYEAADRALYRAKRAGRNRVVLAGSD